MWSCETGAAASGAALGTAVAGGSEADASSTAAPLATAVGLEIEGEALRRTSSVEELKLNVLFAPGAGTGCWASGVPHMPQKR